MWVERAPETLGRDGAVGISWAFSRPMRRWARVPPLVRPGRSSGWSSLQDARRGGRMLRRPGGATTLADRSDARAPRTTAS